jgi:hypothetical protein
MSVPSEIPAEVEALAQQRAAARTEKDWARSDELRDAIAAAGWLIRDTAGGYELSVAPPYAVCKDAAELLRLPVVTGHDVVVGIIVDGWGEDLVSCVEALVTHTAAHVLLLDNASDAGLVVHELAAKFAERVTERHVERALGWSAATVALMSSHDARVHVSMDPSSIVTGDAITPLATAIEGTVVAAAWQGADVDIDDAWRSVTAAGPGEVDVVIGYLMAIDREFGLAHPPHAKATFYRNADIEWSLQMRAAGGVLVVPMAELPVHQERHHGYHDSEPEHRDRESKKTYDRILRDFRGKPEILRTRS